MKKFQIRNPMDWLAMKSSELMVFEVPSSRRVVSFDVNATGPVSVFVGRDGEMTDAVLLAQSDGMFGVSYSADEETFIQFVFGVGDQVFFRSHTGVQSVELLSDEVFTTVVPQGERNVELDRMMQFVRFNELRRDAQLKDEVEALRRAVSDATPSVAVIDEDDGDDGDDTGDLAASVSVAVADGD